MENKEPFSNSCKSVERKGAREPRLKVLRGNVAYSEGDDACALSKDLGLSLFPWQHDVLDIWCARDELGRPAYVTCGLDVPRQNGKNASLEAYEVYLLVVCGWHIVHTAHRVKTYKKSFRRLTRYFEDSRNHPEMCAEVETIRRTNGEEAIYLKNGGYIEFMARTNGGGRGFDDVQLVVFDESQDLTDAQYDAIFYTMAASATGERQVLFMGTPPNEKAPGETFSRIRSSSLAGKTKRTAWLSWSTEKLPPRDSTFEDIEELVYAANPSMGYVLDRDFTEAEFAGGDFVGFAHERLGWWSEVETLSSAIPPKLWRESSISEIADKYKGRAALAVKFSPDGSYYALAGCKLGQRNLKGKAAFELIEVSPTDNGCKELAERLIAAKGNISAVIIDGLSGADALCGLLADAKAPRNYVIRCQTKTVVASSTELLDALKRGDVAHTESAHLDRAAAKCVRRPIGRAGGWGFGAAVGDETTMPEPLEASALALWAAKNTRRNPKRKQRLL